MTKPITVTLNANEIGTITVVFHMFFAVCEMIDVAPPTKLHSDAVSLMENIMKQMEGQVQTDGRKVADSALKD